MHPLAIAVAVFLVVSVAGRDDYAMYVWKSTFDGEKTGCEGKPYPEDINSKLLRDPCVQHSFVSSQARQRLWATCNRGGRNVKRIFLSDVKSRTQGHGDNPNKTCDPWIIQVLDEAAELDIEVFGLFSTDNSKTFRDEDNVRFIQEFNEACQDQMKGRFSGVALNHEYYKNIGRQKHCSRNLDKDRVEYLERLSNARENAGSELDFHFSVSYNWSCSFEFRGQFKPGYEHIMDIVDSIDVQVAFNKPSTMVRRARPLYEAWQKSSTTKTKNFYVLAWTNPNKDCRLSFAPHKKGSTVNSDSCSTGDRSEVGMFAAFDHIEKELPGASCGIHAMGRVYSSGVTEDWPKLE